MVSGLGNLHGHRLGTIKTQILVELEQIRQLVWVNHMPEPSNGDFLVVSILILQQLGIFLGKTLDEPASFVRSTIEGAVGSGLPVISIG